MVINLKEVNSMYLERDRNGNILNLYASFFNEETKHITVYKEIKNQECIVQGLYGEQYTNEIIVNLMKKNTNNFIANISGSPISFFFHKCDFTFV